MDEWEKQLLKLSEMIGRTMMTIDKAMTEFMKTDTFKNIVDFFSNIPDDIQDTELFHNIMQFKNSISTISSLLSAKCDSIISPTYFSKK